MGGVLFDSPLAGSIRQKHSGQNQLILHVDACLAQQLGY
jgi:hypothetical protein